MWAKHESPVRPADWVVSVDLNTHGMPGDFEQFWARKLGENLFEVCCIPFFAYGISLGDLVTTNTDGYVESVVQRSGHRTLRVAIPDKDRLDRVHEIVHEWLLQRELHCEWYSGAYVAVDCSPSNSVSATDVRWLESLAARGDLTFEIDGSGPSANEEVNEG